MALFGHSFPKGVLKPVDPLALKRTDSGALLPTQANPITSWDDGSVRIALLAVECPTLPQGKELECVLVVAKPGNGAPLDLAALLKDRKATIEVAGGGTEQQAAMGSMGDAAAGGTGKGGVWILDLLAPAVAAGNKDRWHDGPLAVSTRVEAKLPAECVGATSVRLVADVVATKDGNLEIDSRLANDAIRIVGGGPATYGYKVTIDGQDVYRQAPFTQIRYTAWVRRNGRAKGGAMPQRPLVRPDYDVLVKSGFTLPWDRGLPSNPNTYRDYVLKTIEYWTPKANDAYPAWGINREATQVGGRQEIGYHTYAGMQWIKHGDPAAQFLAHRQFEVGMSRHQNLWDAELGRWVNVLDWPKLTTDAPWANSCPLGVPREKATAMPKGEGLGCNTKIHVGVDHAHNADYWSAPAVLGGRRMAFDGMAMNACWTPIGQYHKKNKDGTVAAAPDYKTGVGWAPEPGAPQTRTYAWSLRDSARAAAFLPDNYPNRQYFTQNALAYINSYGADLERLKAERGELGGWVAHTGGRRNASFMNSFVMYAALDAVNLGVAGEMGPAVLEYFASFRANAIASPDLNWRNAASGNTLFVGDGTNLFTTWKQVQAAHDEEARKKSNRKEACGINMQPDWDTNMVVGDWMRNVLAGLAMTRDMPVPLTLRVKAMDGVVLFRSEHQHGPEQMPAIKPQNFFHGFENLNSLCPYGSTWRWDVPPAVRTGQVFKMADKTADGIVGLIVTDGGLPRASKPEGSDAFKIVSQPEGNPFELTRGGGLKLVGKAPALPATVRVYATSFDNDGKEYRGPEVDVVVK